MTAPYCFWDVHNADEPLKTLQPIFIDTLRYGPIPRIEGVRDYVSSIDIDNTSWIVQDAKAVENESWLAWRPAVNFTEDAWDGFTRVAED